LIVRHGETYRNKQARWISGQEDGPDAQLNETGRAQVSAFGKQLAERYGKIAAIYSSTLGRARESARILSAYFPSIPLYEDARLKESGYGRYETMLYTVRTEECQKKYREIEQLAQEKGEVLDPFYKWKLRLSDIIPYDPSMTLDLHFGEPESAWEVFERTTAALDEIANRHLGQIILVVTHANVIKTLGIEAESRAKGNTAPLPMFFEPMPGFGVMPVNCSITHFEKVPGQSLRFLKTEIFNE
jgi:broad specificity phosphatase PhoE